MVTVAGLDWNEPRGSLISKFAPPLKIEPHQDRPPDEGGGASKPSEAPKGEFQRQSNPPFKKSLAKSPFQMSDWFAGSLCGSPAAARASRHTRLVSTARSLWIKNSIKGIERRSSTGLPSEDSRCQMARAAAGWPLAAMKSIA